MRCVLAVSSTRIRDLFGVQLLVDIHRVGGWFLLVALMASCAIPGQVYRVSPAIVGSVRGFDPANEQPELRLHVLHRESPELYELRPILLPENGQFSFEPIDLMIAGHEYSKVYRVILHYQESSQDRVVWRGTPCRGNRVRKQDLC